MYRRISILFILIIVYNTIHAQPLYHEPYRPQIHFSPQTAWMNDPNGLVYFQGEYHMFFQYYPDSTVWGPMHWGHAVSRDLIHWKQVNIALYPDSLGYIFSGSVVLDKDNSSGFGRSGSIPLVAIYTQHDPAGEKAKTNLYQNQSIAYSLDAGEKWIKFKGNPVLKTPNLPDFRDPKVRWYPDNKKWIMTLAAGDRVMFFSSKDLKTWNKESEFGLGIGAHGGVWECPDLIPFDVEGKKVWLLIVSINPGGVQGGSGTQYFTGWFDGHIFSATDSNTRWIDYGADNYAGVSFSNTGNEKIFLGWMSNWQYATRVPTTKWRSAMTLPRKLDLKKIGSAYFTTMMPVSSIKNLIVASEEYEPVSGSKEIQLESPTLLEFSMAELHSFSFIFSNALNQQLKLGYDQSMNAFYIDRSGAGKMDFDPGFAAIHYGKRIAQTKDSKIIMILDNASLELFADGGLTTMTEIFFPDRPFNMFKAGLANKKMQKIKISRLKSIWP
jgi:fructan beta-fructosidase